MSLFAFASGYSEAAALFHVSKLKSRFPNLEDKSKTCQMFVAIEMKDNRCLTFYPARYFILP
jgi:hypothetical protein